MRPTSASLSNDVVGKKQVARPARQLCRQAARHFALAGFLLAALCLGLYVQLSKFLSVMPTASMFFIALGLWLAVGFQAWRGLAWHPHQNFGLANAVTLYRSAGTVLIASLIPVAELLPDNGLWLITLLAILLLSLDGIDGYLARRTRLTSSFGARFDMEIDALLILVISVFLWQSGKIGFWIMALGLMRYGFVLASLWSKPLRGQLFPSFRRKLVCVFQLVALCAILSPLVSPPLSHLVGVLALISLTGSFARDILWLYRHQSPDDTSAAHNAPGTVASIDANP